MADYLVTYEELQSVANAIREGAGLDPLSRTGGDYIVNEDDLVDLADAIRTATGTEADLEWPDDFITQIESLSGMTIPSGTTTLAFPQGYIDIIETATPEEEGPGTITIYAVYIPSSSQLQDAQQRGILSAAAATELSYTYNVEARDKIPITVGSPEYSEHIIPQLKSRLSASDIENSIFEGTIQCSSESFFNTLISLINNIINTVLTKGYDSTLLPDNVAFVNVDPSTYEEIETGAQVCYQGEPTQTIFRILSNNFNQNDFTIENLNSDLYLEIRLMADDQLNDLL